jgi:hypothetical protein
MRFFLEIFIQSHRPERWFGVWFLKRSGPISRSRLRLPILVCHKGPCPGNCIREWENSLECSSSQKDAGKNGTPLSPPSPQHVTHHTHHTHTQTMGTDYTPPEIYSTMKIFLAEQPRNILDTGMYVARGGAKLGRKVGKKENINPREDLNVGMAMGRGSGH